MSTWLQDGKSAIHEALADAFHKIEEGAKAGMRRPFREEFYELFLILIPTSRARRARPQK